MKVTVKRFHNATSKRTGRDFEIVEAVQADNTPIKFFAAPDEYKTGDVVELYVDIDYNYNARISHKRA